MKHETKWFRPLDAGEVECTLCPMNCHLAEGQTGICRGRVNEGGRLYSANYGEVVSVAIDPIEKKPLYHFCPGTDILSTGPNCCNLRCRHCQNWSISQVTVPTQYCSPAELVELAVSRNSIGIAFTYTEPLVWWEFVHDTSQLLKERGLKSVLVSNGFINVDPLEELLPLIDAANIDLKGMRPDFYTRICKGDLAPILENIRRLADSHVHLEITNLVIPGYNDSEEELTALVDFVAGVSPRIPVHFSAYHPDYQLDAPRTPREKMIRALEIGRSRLTYCFAGNMRIDGAADTRCPECDNLLIERSGFLPRFAGLTGSRCAACGAESGIIRQ